jgi:hypothetical protein
MPKLRHAVSGAIYDLEPEGLVRVETPDGAFGWFNADASWHHGELKEADPHFIGWVAGTRVRSTRAEGTR